MIQNFLNAGADESLVVSILGQSNAEGSYTGAPPVEYQGQLENIYIWTASGWQLLEYGVNCQGLLSTDHASELSLALSLRDYYNKRIYVVKYAVGGTNLDQNWAEDGSTYLDALSWHNAAMANLFEAGKSPKVVICNWNQGESDGASESISLRYDANLTALVSRFRNEFSFASESLFISCRLSTELDDWLGTYPYYANVRSAQENNTAIDGWYNQDDLPFLSTVHFDSDGQIIIGERVAEFITS